MRRLFKKYSLLLWLGLLLVSGCLAGSAVMLTMSKNLLMQQSLNKTLPAIGDSLTSEIRLAIGRAQTALPGLSEDPLLREWLMDADQDNQPVIAHLKSMRKKDNPATIFLVSEKDQKYVDSAGTVRILNPENLSDSWYGKAHASTRPAEIMLQSEPGSDVAQILVSYRMFDSERHQIGNAGLFMPLDMLSLAMDRYVGDGSHSVYFADQSGKIVFSDSKSKRVGNLHELEGLNLIASKLLNNQHSTLSTSYDRSGSGIMLNARYIPELGLYLMVEESPAVAELGARQVGYVNAAIGLAMALLALLIAGASIARHQNRMRMLASKDSMTGLLNRQSFATSFKDAALEMQRLKLPLSFILFDIDYLKKINEAYGHANGDRIIMDIARLSKRSVRGSDLVCRWGGEQFALLLQRCELEQAYKVAEQLRLNVQNYAFSIDDKKAPVTISLGVAEWTADESIDELFGRADDAVFLAKSEGRNRAEISYFVNA